MRTSRTTTDEPSCPLCAAYGAQTVTEEIREDAASYREIDEGCTEPLRGMLCVECEIEMDGPDPDLTAALARARARGDDACPNCGTGPNQRPSDHAGECVRRGPASRLGSAAPEVG